MIVELRIVGPSFVIFFLSGKHYNRGVRTHNSYGHIVLSVTKKFEAWVGKQDKEEKILSEQLFSALERRRQELILDCNNFLTLPPCSWLSIVPCSSHLSQNCGCDTSKWCDCYCCSFDQCG